MPSKPIARRWNVLGICLAWSTLMTAHGPPAGANEAPVIVTRAEWKASPALSRIAARKQTPRYITIHHTGAAQNSKRNVEYKMRSLQRFSQKKTKLASGRVKPAWLDVPYHYYIGLSGRIAEGRDIQVAGDTNTNYSTEGHIQIVLEGNFEKHEPSSAQLKSLVKLTDWLSYKWKVPADRIRSHKHYASTLCPGEHLVGVIKSLREKNN